MDAEYALGDTIRNARLKNGMTQEYLAEKLNITPGHLQHIERSFRKPSVPMLLKMMELLSFSVDELVFNAKRKTICVDGLSSQQIAALEFLIETMR